MSTSRQQAIKSQRFSDDTGWPKKDCAQCHGRGHTGYHKGVDFFRPCPCLDRSAREIDKAASRALYLKHKLEWLNSMRESRVSQAEYFLLSERLEIVRAILNGSEVRRYYKHQGFFSADDKLTVDGVSVDKDFMLQVFEHLTPCSKQEDSDGRDYWLFSPSIERVTSLQEYAKELERKMEALLPAFEK
jgi:hypothetical protein